MLLLIVFIITTTVCSSRNKEKHSIRYYPVRRDVYTNTQVARGRLEEAGGLESFMLKPSSLSSSSSSSASSSSSSSSSKYSYDDFKRKLQCVDYEPQLYSNGIYHLLNLFPITNDTIDLTAAYAEKPCLDGHKRIDWESCQQTAKLLKANKRSELKDIRKPVNYELENVRLIRIINGTAFYDWPWNSEKNWKIDSQYTLLRLIVSTLNKISDIPDCVFMSISFDYSLLPSYFPMAIISHGPSISNADIPFPWTLVVNDEIILHQKYFSKQQKVNNDNVYDANSEHLKDLDPIDKANNNYTDIYNKYYNPDNNKVWKSRENKAAFYGSLWFSQIGIGRQIVMDLAKRFPDLISANYTHDIGASPYRSPKVNEVFNKRIDDIKDSKLRAMIPLNQYMRQFKYLVVLAGNSISGRLCTFMAHSGAVIMLQETDMVYHFSSRLKPWVHYVPLSMTAADLPEKVRWLQNNDAFARQLARNARNFGLSYLRLEDYYCYTAYLLHHFGKVVDKSALKPNQLKKIIL